MAEKKNEAEAQAQAQPVRRPLSGTDMATGLSYERAIAEAQARLDAAIAAQTMFVAHLRTSHNAPEGEYELKNWVEGFVLVQGETEPKD